MKFTRSRTRISDLEKRISALESRGLHIPPEVTIELGKIDFKLLHRLVNDASARAARAGANGTGVNGWMR